MDRRRVLIGLVVVIWAFIAMAAQGGPTYTSVSPHPTAGAACAGGRVQIESDTGKRWCCVASHWTDCSSTDRVRATGAPTDRPIADHLRTLPDVAWDAVNNSSAMVTATGAGVAHTLADHLRYLPDLAGATSHGRVCDSSSAHPTCGEVTINKNPAGSGYGLSIYYAAGTDGGAHGNPGTGPDSGTSLVGLYGWNGTFGAPSTVLGRGNYMNGWLIVSGDMANWNDPLGTPRSATTGLGAAHAPGGSDPFMIGCVPDINGPCMQIRGDTSNAANSALSVVDATTGTQNRAFYLEFTGQHRWGVSSRAALDVSIGRGASNEIWVGDGNSTQNANGYLRASRLYVGGSTGYLFWNPASSLIATNAGFTVNGDLWVAGGQSAYLDTVHSSAGSVPLTLAPNAGYGIKVATSGARPTCDSTKRMQLFTVQGGAGVKDSVEICAKDAGDAYAWRTIY